MWTKPAENNKKCIGYPILGRLSGGNGMVYVSRSSVRFCQPGIALFPLVKSEQSRADESPCTDRQLTGVCVCVCVCLRILKLNKLHTSVLVSYSTLLHAPNSDAINPSINFFNSYQIKSFKLTKY